MGFYRTAADGVLILHTGFIAFVVFGLIIVLGGKLAGWQWVRNFWFRVVHLLFIAFVVVQAFLAITCPLTTLENNLRERAGETGYDAGGFIQYWLHELIFFQAEPWVFTLCYSIFGLMVVAALLWVPPRRPSWIQPKGTLEAAPTASSADPGQS